MDERTDTMRVTGSPAGTGFLSQERWLPLAFSGILMAAVLFAASRWSTFLAHDLAEMFSFLEGMLLRLTGKGRGESQAVLEPVT